MKKTTHHFSRKKRQLQFLFKQLKNESFLSVRQRNKAILKIRRLVNILTSRLGIKGLRRALGFGLFALLCGSPQNTSAQTFGPLEVDPFGSTVSYNNALQDAKDINGDGLLDLFAGGMMHYLNIFEQDIRVQMNNGTINAPLYNQSEINPFGINTEVYDDEFMGTFLVTDWDLDGDFDILSAGFYDDFQHFFENIGTITNPVFTSPVPESGLPLFGEFNKLFDLDADGDYDVVSVSYNDPVVIYQNIGNAENPSWELDWNGNDLLSELLVNGDDEYFFYDFKDLDGDGDLDFFGIRLSPFNNINDTYYLENIGTPKEPVFDNLSENSLIDLGSNGSNWPLFVDTDADGDLDILWGYHDQNLWHQENTASYPSSASKNFEIFQLESISFQMSDFAYDNDNMSAFSAIRIMSLPANGELLLDGNPVQEYQLINVSDIDNMSFTPTGDEFGIDYGSFTFRVGSSENLFSPQDYTMSIDVQEISSTSDLTVLGKTKISPNPVADKLNIEMEFDVTPKELQIEIRQSNNQLVRLIRPEIHSMVNLELETSDLPAGVYFVRIISRKESVVHPFVKY